MGVQISTMRSAGVVAALLSAGALAACGGSDDSSTATDAAATSTAPQGAESTRLALRADEAGGLAFSRTTLRSGPGDVTIALANPSGNQLPHAIEIEGEGVEQESATIEPGAVTTVRANLRPGTYTFYCPVGDHRQQGMEGTLTVG
jgi:uncharacterized cupredoxin-like copper-binding protein